MKAFELLAEVDDLHCLSVKVPNSVLPGTVRIIVLSPESEEDEAGAAWVAGISHEWTEDLMDVRQDIYTLEDGAPVSAAR